MPRADSKQHLGPQFYHAQFPNSSYLPDSSPSSSPPAATATSTPKKKHVCATCERAFTTSGHLARHSRVHTGERNHKCPFPGCDTRCSRQDNLQQQWVPVFSVIDHDYWLFFPPAIEFTCLQDPDEVRHALLRQKRWMGKRELVM